jgi:hypothetical protein
MTTFRRTTNPREFPIEVCALFEKASFTPVRMPGDDKSYATESEAIGDRLNLARWRAQMLRSPDTPKAFAAVLKTIQFKQIEKGEDGWHFSVEPLATNRTVQTVATAMGDVGPADEFWRQFE